MLIGRSSVLVGRRVMKGFITIEMTLAVVFIIAYPFFFYEYQRAVDRWVMNSCYKSGLMFYDAEEEKNI